jgi:hypothetical protein
MPWRRSKNFPARVAEVRQKLAPGTPIEVWCQDEMRVGQKNKLTYRWARKGSRPRATHDQRTQSTYLFGAVCPERGAGAALVLPACNSEAMQLHLDEIATRVTPGAHAIVLLDQAGWHGGKVLKVPHNISLMPLPPARPRTQRPGKHLALHATELALEPGLQILRRYRRSLLLRLEHAHRSALEDHVRRAPRLGDRGLLNVRIGISPVIPSTLGTVKAFRLRRLCRPVRR